MSLTEEQLQKEFDRVDKDKNGTITVEELRKYYLPMQEMLGIAPQLAEQEIRGLIKRLDVDDSGTISFEGKALLFFPHSVDIRDDFSFRIQTISVEKIDPEALVTLTNILTKLN